MAVALKIAKPEEERERLSLEKQMSNIQQEARMVLPGIQALFGFQLIAVFNDKFKELAELDRNLHLVATSLTLVAIGLMLTPASMHRIADPDHVSKKLVKLSTRLLAFGMVPLCGALALDFYLFSHIVTKDERLPMLFGSTLLVALLALWFGWPGLIKAKSRE